MKLMQPRLTTELFQDMKWLYEIKYDGFRVRIEWKHQKMNIWSRQNKLLTKRFPEIVAACARIQRDIEKYLPLQFDGEITVLNNAYQANFSKLQQRGRLKNDEKINIIAQNRPASLIVFDLLQVRGASCVHLPLKKRKEFLEQIFDKIDIHEIRLIEVFHHYKTIANVAFANQSEGIILKRKTSVYHAGKLHDDWWKWKNWCTVHVFLTAYYEENGYFEIAVYHDEDIYPIGTCKHGLTVDEYQVIKTLFREKGQQKGNRYELPPAICIAIHTIGMADGVLREPEFVAVLPGENPRACTMERVELALAPLPKIDIANESKLFWPSLKVGKKVFLTYLREIYPYMIPYLRERVLTVIRCPDGIEKPCFFQKNAPQYAPEFIDVAEFAGKQQIVCNDLETLIWLGNHGALEYHIPFQCVNEVTPTEIVFDLDPATTSDFHSAVKAAFVMKQLFDKIGLHSFVKTSGNKGLHIHLPLPFKAMTYSETAIFTEAVAKTVEQQNPTLFTTERMKNARKGRVYLDYVQYGRNKTVIAPYSTRINPQATVAMPLYWEELENSELHPEQFTVEEVPKLVVDRGCPWLFSYERARGANSLLKLIVQNGLR